MNSTVTIVGSQHGHLHGHHHLHGLIPIPTAAGINLSENSALQSFLSQISSDVTAAGSVMQLEVVPPPGALPVPSPSSDGYSPLELTAPSAGGGHQSGPTSTAPASISASVPAGYQTIVVDAPGSFSLAGAAMTKGTYVLGAASQVDLTTDEARSSVIAGGGADTLNVMGSDAVSILGGSAVVTAGGAADTIEAYGVARTQVTGVGAVTDQLQFLNAGNGVATVFGGEGRVTAFGGGGGGSFYAGSAGDISLPGGAGTVSRHGQGNGDVLEAGVSTGGATVAGANVLFAGRGNETLFATPFSGVNILIGGSGADSIRGDGQLLQVLAAEPGQETLTGTSMQGAFNQHEFGVMPTSGARDLITNFQMKSDIFTVGDGASIAGVADPPSATGALVRLSDGTSVLLKGVNSGPINVQGSGHNFL